MLQYNTMRFDTDEFNPYIRQALLVSKTPLNLSNFNRLDQITVQGNQPDGSKRRFLFKMGDKVYKFDGQNAVEYSGDITIDNVLADGNTAAQVEAVRSNRQLVGNLVYPIIALYTEVQDAPSAKLVASASFVQEILDFSDERAVQYFGASDGTSDRPTAKILDVEFDAVINGDASANLLIRLLQGNVWSNYMDIDDARGQLASAFQVKLLYHVDAANGINSAKIKKYYVHFATEYDSIVFGDVAYIYSRVKYCVRNLSNAVLVVRHEDLDGGSLDADVSFQVTRTHRYNLRLGSIGFTEKTFTAEHEFFPGTLKLFLDGVETSNFTFDTADRSITIPDDDSRPLAEVTVEYTSPALEEIFLPMIRDKVQPTGNGFFTTRFALPNPDFDAKNLTTSVVRIKLNRGYHSTTISETGTGSPRTITFAHSPDDIECDADSWDFDDDSNAFTFTHAAGQPVNISYSWHGKTPVVTGWAASWSA